MLDLSTRPLVWALVAWPLLVLAACSATGSRSIEPGVAASPSKAQSPARPGELTSLRRADTTWLERVSFGLNDSAVAEYHRLGRDRYLDAQLSPGSVTMSGPISAQIHSIEVNQVDPAKALASLQDRRRQLNAMPDGPDKEQARKALNDEGGRQAYQAIRLELLQAVYSPAQLREQMVWFWLNHFSVHQNKADLRWLISDYAEKAIRPNALGHFRDLVLATLEHPAMLQYLDNSQNANGHINENYARELLELHTLGVQSGYTQQDVQQLAKVLTGVGVNAGREPKLKKEWQPLYWRRGAFEFNPARHDFSAKTLLGHRIDAQGFSEVEAAVTLIVHEPACARFISRQLATYFVGDVPPPHLVEAMAQTFQKTDGDIAATLRTLFLSREFSASGGTKFKDPMRYVVAAVRLAYDGRVITNSRPMLDWLNALGEAPFGRQTPDGYPLTGAGWESPGQMSRRFEIARAIGTGNVHLFDSEDGGPPGGTGFPQLSNRAFYEAIEPFLATNTRAALSKATSPQEWNTFLLASPEMNYE
jgi:uncharacterized protein (DUF1800 family)